MGVAWIVVGVGIVLVVYADAFVTTLAVQAGAGPVTRRLTGACWRLALTVCQRGRGRRCLSRLGPFFLVGTVVLWVLGLWVGWTLVLLGGDDVVRVASTGEPVGVLGTIYFVGFNLVTLGVGDVAASGFGWGVIATVASFGGLFLLTLSITYLLSVVSAVVSRRALAVQIGSMGSSPSALAGWAWTETGVSDAAMQQMGSLADPLVAASERHLAFPILEYFASAEAVASAPLAVARLDEALRLLEHGVRPADRPGRDVTAPIRGAVDRYVEVVTRNTRVASGAKPPPPATEHLGVLRSQGVPVVSDAEFASSMERFLHGRAAMDHHVAQSGWDWSAAEGAQVGESP